jgi:hypothetical protein
LDRVVKNTSLQGPALKEFERLGAMRYVSGYASKSDQTLPGRKVGRYWGIVARQNVPWGKRETMVLDRVQSKFVMRTARRFIQSVNRQTRIRRVAKQVGLKPSELISSGGWFEGNGIDWGKRFRAAGRRMPQKLRLRNLRSLNVFLDAEFWAGKLPDLLKAAGVKKTVFVSSRETV